MDMQQLAALVIVAAAAGSLLLRLWRQLRGARDENCPGCGGCGQTSTAPQATPLITLSTGPRPKPTVRLPHQASHEPVEQNKR